MVFHYSRQHWTMKPSSGVSKKPFLTGSPTIRGWKNGLLNSVSRLNQGLFYCKNNARVSGRSCDRGRAPTLRTKNGSLKKIGCWTVPSHITAECISGTIRLDFTQAHCSHSEVAVDVSARSGTVLIIVPNGWGVNFDQVSATSGSVINKVGELAEPGCPILRVKGKVLSGLIKARYPRRSFRDWLRSFSR